MYENPKTRRLLNDLEDLLVQEFRTLESLILVTREERLEFSKHNADGIMLLVEKKETILDQLSLMEEKRRTFVQEICMEMGVQTESSSLDAILASLEKPSAERISRLNGGIATLVSQARDLNYGNSALAQTALDWLATTKAFIYSLYQPQMNYQAPGAPVYEHEALWDVEHRI
jgi:flagellar biosynthesis/type III secretory pathway chaperone